MKNIAATEPLTLTLTATQAAKLLGISRSQYYRMHTAGKVPEPVKLGGAVRWRRLELIEWLDAGAPSRDRWSSMRKARR